MYIRKRLQHLHLYSNQHLQRPANAKHYYQGSFCRPGQKKKPGYFQICAEAAGRNGEKKINLLSIMNNANTKL